LGSLEANCRYNQTSRSLKDGYRFKVDPVESPGTRSEDNKRQAGWGATHAKTIPFASQAAKSLAGKQPQQLFLLD